MDAAERYIAPTILVKIAENDAVMTEKIFGPILPVLSYTLLPDALQKINQRSKPLALYIFSRNRHNIEQITESTSAGGTCINDAVLHFMHPNPSFFGGQSQRNGQCARRVWLLRLLARARLPAPRAAGPDEAAASALHRSRALPGEACARVVVRVLEHWLFRVWTRKVKSPHPFF